jgi:hypothetical protein
VAILVGAQASADEIDDALATPNDPAVSLVPACNGIPKDAQIEALQLIKSNVCAAFTEVLNTQSGDLIGFQIQDTYLQLQVRLSMTPLCAASLMAVFAQKVISGSFSAGSCPAGN